jgi:hypothetical protein
VDAADAIHDEKNHFPVVFLGESAHQVEMGGHV